MMMLKSMHSLVCLGFVAALGLGAMGCSAGVDGAGNSAGQETTPSGDAVHPNVPPTPPSYLFDPSASNTLGNFNGTPPNVYGVRNGSASSTNPDGFLGSFFTPNDPAWVGGWNGSAWIWGAWQTTFDAGVWGGGVGGDIPCPSALNTTVNYWLLGYDNQTQSWSNSYAMTRYCSSTPGLTPDVQQ